MDTPERTVGVLEHFNVEREAFASRPAPEPIRESSPEAVAIEDLERVQRLALDARRLTRPDYNHLGGPGPTQLAALDLYQRNYGWYLRAHRLGIPRQFWRATIEENAPAVRDTAALRAVRAFCHDVDGRCLGLLGPTGGGKTFGAIAAIRAHATHRSAAVAFHHVPALVRGLLNFETRDSLMANVCELELLVLDDLGAQYSRDGGGQGDALVEELVWNREAYRRATIFTSNLRRAALEERLGDRVSDRLRSWADLHELPGASLRRARS